MRVEKELVVNAPIEKVYDLWVDFENFPKFMEHVEEVRRTGPDTLHWRAHIGGRTQEWNARIVGMVENRTVTWRSTSGSQNAGAVTLSSHGNTTVMHVVIEYEPNFLEAIFDTVTRFTSRSVEEDLERFKRLAEGLDPKREEQLRSERTPLAQAADAIGGSDWENKDEKAQAGNWENEAASGGTNWEADGAQGETSTSTGAGNAGAISPSSVAAERVRDTISGGDTDWERDEQGSRKEGILDRIGGILGDKDESWEAEAPDPNANRAEEMVDNAIADLRGGDWERESGEGNAALNRAADAMGGSGSDWEGRAGGVVGNIEEAVGGDADANWEGDGGSGVLNRIEGAVEGDRDDWERQRTPRGTIRAKTDDEDNATTSATTGGMVAGGAALGATAGLVANDMGGGDTDSAVAADADAPITGDTVGDTEATDTAVTSSEPADTADATPSILTESGDVAPINMAEVAPTAAAALGNVGVDTSGSSAGGSGDDTLEANLEAAPAAGSVDMVQDTATAEPGLDAATMRDTVGGDEGGDASDSPVPADANVAMPMGEQSGLTDNTAANLQGGSMGPSLYVEEAKDVLPAGADETGRANVGDLPTMGTSSEDSGEGVTSVTGSDFSNEGEGTAPVGQGGAAKSYAMPIDTTASDAQTTSDTDWADDSASAAGSNNAPTDDSSAAAPTDMVDNAAPLAGAPEGDASSGLVMENAPSSYVDFSTTEAGMTSDNAATAPAADDSATTSASDADDTTGGDLVAGAAETAPGDNPPEWSASDSSGASGFMDNPPTDDATTGPSSYTGSETADTAPASDNVGATDWSASDTTGSGDYASSEPAADDSAATGADDWTGGPIDSGLAADDTSSASDGWDATPASASSNYDSDNVIDSGLADEPGSTDNAGWSDTATDEPAVMASDMNSLPALSWDDSASDSGATDTATSWAAVPSDTAPIDAAAMAGDTSAEAATDTGPISDVATTGDGSWSSSDDAPAWSPSSDTAPMSGDALSDGDAWTGSPSADDSAPAESAYRSNMGWTTPLYDNDIADTAPEAAAADWSASDSAATSQAVPRNTEPLGEAGPLPDAAWAAGDSWNTPAADSADDADSDVLIGSTDEVRDSGWGSAVDDTDDASPSLDADAVDSVTGEPAANADYPLAWGGGRTTERLPYEGDADVSGDDTATADDSAATWGQPITGDVVQVAPAADMADAAPAWSDTGSGDVADDTASGWAASDSTGYSAGGEPPASDADTVSPSDDGGNIGGWITSAAGAAGAGGMGFSPALAAGAIFRQSEADTTNPLTDQPTPQPDVPADSSMAVEDPAAVDVAPTLAGVDTADVVGATNSDYPAPANYAASDYSPAAGDYTTDYSAPAADDTASAWSPGISGDVVEAPATDYTAAPPADLADMGTYAPVADAAPAWSDVSSGDINSESATPGDEVPPAASDSDDSGMGGWVMAAGAGAALAGGAAYRMAADDAADAAPADSGTVAEPATDESTAVWSNTSADNTQPADDVTTTAEAAEDSAGSVEPAALDAAEASSSGRIAIAGWDYSIDDTPENRARGSGETL